MSGNAKMPYPATHMAERTVKSSNTERYSGKPEKNKITAAIASKFP